MILREYVSLNKLTNNDQVDENTSACGIDHMYIIN